MTPGLFSTAIPGLQLAWDATSLAMLAECPRKYYYSMVEGWRSRSTAPPLTFGKSWHDGLEQRDRGLAAGKSRDEALAHAIRFISGALDSPDPDDGTPRHGFTPGDDNRRTLLTLIRSLVWYDAQYENDPAKLYWLDSNTPAIELTFRFDTHIRTSSGEAITWGGHMDKVVEYADSIYIMEHKHTVSALNSYYFDRYKPNLQVEGYYFGGAVVLPEVPAGVIIDATEVKATFSRFARGIVPLGDEHKEEFLAEFRTWMKLAEEFALTQHWPMNKTACTSKFGACPFREVCSKSPHMRQSYLKADYKQERWDPLKVRGVSDE